MEFNLTINEPGSFFHFLEALSEWDIHVRKRAKDYYEKKFPLRKEDKELLKDFREIRKKHPWKKMDSDFYPSKTYSEAKSKLQKRLNKKEYKKIGEIIDHFKKNISQIFKEWKPYLTHRKKQLEKELKREKIKKIIKDLAFFYEAKNLPNNITVHLLVNTGNKSSGGGANITPRNNITLEPYQLKRKTNSPISKDMAILLHETLHVIEHKSPDNKMKKFMNAARKEKVETGILREAIADTMLPFGHLAQKYNITRMNLKEFSKIRAISKLKNSDPRAYYRKSRNKLSWMILPLTVNQFANEKTFFEKKYQRLCIQKFKEMRKKT